MKKIIWFFTLIWFIVASNMQLVHAVEMKNDLMYKNHIMQKVDNTAFCDNSNKNDKNECYKEIILDKYVSKQEKTKTNTILFTVLPITFFSDKTIKLYKIFYNIKYIWKIPIFEKSSYLNLLWIVKNLN